MSRGVSSRVYAASAVLRLLVPREEAARLVSPSSGALEAVDDHSCLLRTGAASLDVLVLHVALIGVDFEVVEPVELTEHVRVLRDRLSRSLR